MQDTPPTKKLGGLTPYTEGKPQESGGDTTMVDKSSDDTPTSSAKSSLYNPSTEYGPPASWFNSPLNRRAVVSGDTTMAESSREQVSPSSSAINAVASRPAKNRLPHPQK